MDVKVIDLTDYLVRSLGFADKDDTHKTLSAWKSFGEMINYMTPEVMDALMPHMLPEVIPMILEDMIDSLKVYKF